MRLKKRKLWSALKKEKQKGKKQLNKTNFKKKEKKRGLEGNVEQIERTEQRI